MNFLYITNINYLDVLYSGVKKKIDGQFSVFKKYFDSEIVFFKNRSFCIGKEIEDIIIEKSYDSKEDYFNTILNRIKEKNIDLIYIRYILSDKKFLSFIRNIKKNNPNTIIITEFPTYPYDFEFKRIKDKLRVIRDRIYRNQYKNYIDLATTYTEHKMIFGIPVLVLNNGLDIEKVNFSDKIDFDENSLHLVGIANVSKWHGYDRVIAGIKKYYDNPGNKYKVYFHVVGEGDEIHNLKEISSNLLPEGTVIFHGSKDGKDLDKIVEKCMIGIGSLGMHRKKLLSESSLKNREYCARGLPFVYSVTDTDFENFDFNFRISYDDEPLNINNLIDFYSSLKKKYSNYKIEMRNYSIENLTWESKLNELLNKINDLKLGRK